MYYLRLANDNDIDTLLGILKLFHKESTYSNLEFNDLRVRDILVDSLLSSNDNKVIILAITKDTNEIVGLIAGQTSIAPFSYQKVGVETAWYMLQEHRGSRIALELLGAFEEWCRLVGCHLIQMSSLASSNAIVDTIYNHRNYHMVEKSYLKEIQ